MACLRHAWTDLGLAEVYSMTARLNLPSQRVMQKIGMTHLPDQDFEHPNVPAGSPLRRHVLYRIANPDRTWSVSRS
jgi:RimJ/RimL family protein N-acetyltransferase